MRADRLLFVLLLTGVSVAQGADTLAWVSDAGGFLNRDSQGRVVGVDLRASWAGDSDLVSLSSVPTLTTLDLSETRITDHGLRQLKNAPAIRDLNLRYAELITDQGVASLKAWKHLSRLNMEGTKITDSGLQQLSALSSLQSLNIGSVLVTDAGLEALTSLINLKELTLGGNKLTDAGLQTIRQLPGLTYLDLGGAQRTDSGMWTVSFTQSGLEAIATLKNLRGLRLNGTLTSGRGLTIINALPRLELLDLHGCANIGDDAVPVLIALQSLQSVDLTDTKISPAALERLRQSRRNLRIVHGASDQKPKAASEER